jgi:succinoglycan biosynthesis transport protein ExoP
MELGNFFKVLSRHKLTLIIIPLLTVILTYFLVRNQPDTYISDTQIATGLVDQTQTATPTTTGTAAGTGSPDQINQDFDNLIEIMKSKKILNQVSYLLMIHDLTSAQPYEKPSKIFLQLNKAARAHALFVYTDFYNNHTALSLFNGDQNGLHTLMRSMGYDDESLLKTLNIYRAQSSDFIDIEYSSSNPDMAAYIVNSLAHEFITYYTSIVKDNQRKELAFLAGLVASKKDTLNARINNLRIFKVKNNILDIAEESRAVYTQIGDYQGHLDQAQRDAISAEAAIKNIESQLKPTNRKNLGNLLIPVNQSIVNITEQMKTLNERYLASNFNSTYKTRIDSLQRIVDEKITQSSDKGVVSPASTQQNLIQERITLQLQYVLAKSTIGSLQEGLKELNNKLNSIVPNQAVVAQNESAIDIAQKEYLDILNKYNQAGLDANYTGKLKQLEEAMPGAAQPSKKMVLVVLSGIVSFVFCVLVLFILYFFDNTVKTPDELANKTGAPVLGHLNLLSGQAIDLTKVWMDNSPDTETYNFKNLMQSLRYEVDAEMGKNKLLLINSLADGEGKTFVATNLAYAYSLINKKVLLIDGNFHKPGITQSVKSKLFIEDYLNGTSPDFTNLSHSKITVFSNKGGDGSLLELNAENTIKEKFDQLKHSFDVIIIETSSLSTLHKSKEWNKFADKILSIFESGKSITDAQKANVEYMKSLDGKFMGWVLNVANKSNNMAEVVKE